MKTLGMILARLTTLLFLLGGGYVAFDAVRTARKAKQHKAQQTAPFGDNHYETVKQAIPEHASDADTKPMIRERQGIALDTNT